MMHFLTYADNYATGYFQKQGFTKGITLEKSVWMGYMKDFEGGTLMQCTMVPRVRYLEVGRLLLKQKETVRAKIRLLSKSHIVHEPPAQWAPRGVMTPVDLATIEERLESDHYSAPREMVADLKLMFSNFRQYNDATTVYNKCAVKLEKYMWSLIKDFPEWVDLLEERGVGL